MKKYSLDSAPANLPNTSDRSIDINRKADAPSPPRTTTRRGQMRPVGSCLSLARSEPRAHRVAGLDRRAEQRSVVSGRNRPERPIWSRTPAARLAKEPDSAIDVGLVVPHVRGAALQRGHVVIERQRGRNQRLKHRLRAALQLTKYCNVLSGGRAAGSNPIPPFNAKAYCWPGFGNRAAIATASTSAC
jgi:hypothetical protein